MSSGSSSYHLANWTAVGEGFSINVDSPESLGDAFEIYDPHSGVTKFGRRIPGSIISSKRIPGSIISSYPYLYDKGRMVNVSDYSLSPHTFPPLQVIKDKRRLVKVLWMPYSERVLNAVIGAQAEAYICTGLDREKKMIAFPLRVNKETDLQSDTPPAYKLDWFPEGYPETFAFHMGVFDEILKVFGGTGVINPFILRDDMDCEMYCIQFRPVGGEEEERDASLR
jgi:hypothetical protein